MDTLTTTNAMPDAAPGADGHGWLREDRSLHHDVYAVIVEWVQDGTLRPGDRISEAAIARQLGISRGPVREAMARLDNEGLVIRRPRRGAVVADVTAKDLDDIVAVRQLVEGYAARCASQLLSQDDASELERLIAAMHTSALAGQWTETATLNARFHQTVVRIADNRLLHRLWQTLHPLGWLLAPTVSPHQPHDPDDLRARHEALVAALRTGDPDQAEAAFRQHVQQTEQQVRHRLSQTGPDARSAPATDQSATGPPRAVP